MRYLLLALLTAGCTASGPIYVDERFSAEEQADIQHAADVWEGRIDLVFGAHVNAFETDRRTLVRTDKQVIQMVAGESREAATMPGGQTMIAASQVPRELFAALVAHELGHQLGLHHVAEPTALMFEKTSHETRFCITRADAQEYQKATGESLAATCQ